MEQLFHNAKVGDKVIDYRFGRGNVFQVDDDKKPIGVEFKTGHGWFGMNGKMFEDHPGPTCYPIDKAPQHLLDMFPEKKTFREYSSSRMAFGLFDTKTNNMVDIKETREEAEEAAKFFVSTVVVVECTVAISFDLEVSA